MTWGFSRPVTRRSVLAGWLPARPAPSLVHRLAMGLQPASRQARRQAWYIYVPIFWTSRAWLQPPPRRDPSLLGLSRSVLAGCRPSRRLAWYGWPRVCRARAAGIYIKNFFKLNSLLLFFFSKKLQFFFFFFQKYYKFPQS